MKKLTLFEYEAITAQLTNKQLKSLANLQHGGKTILEVHGNYLRATSFVGIVQLPGLTLEILPKLYRDSALETEQSIINLLHLLQYTRKLFRTIKQSDISHLRKRKTNFFEVLIYLFASHLSDLMKAGLHRIYRHVDEESPFLKGSWRISEQLGRSAVIAQHFHITFDEHTENNPLNRVLKFVTKRLLSVTKNAHNARILNENLLVLPEVDELQVVTHSELEAIHFTRLNERYRPLFELARLFLSGLSIELSGANTPSYAFVFDMNALFEEFIAEFLRQEHVLNNTFYADCTIRSQSGIRYLVRHGESELFQLRPDIRLERANETCCIIDTKYKLLSGGKKTGISQNDMYQMYVYAGRYRCSRAILLYPEHTSIGQRKLRFDAHDNIWIEVHTIDICHDFSKRVNKQNLKAELQKILEFNFG